MALIPGTLPSDTCYGTPQDLLELFAQYLDVPAFALNSKVVFSTSSAGLTADVVWFDTTTATNPILKITVGGGFTDYVKNYITNAPVVTIVGADSVLILDASDSGNTKRGLVSNIVALAGKVVQIVEGSTSTSVTVSTLTLTDTGLTVTITPTSASNKILILISQNYNAFRSSSGQGIKFNVLRGASVIYAGSSSDTDILTSVGNSTTSQLIGTWSFQYLDSPATTSATIYKVRGRPAYNDASGYAAFQSNAERSSIVAIEVTP